MTAPRWFKGNLHMHSFWSDGHDFPEVIADWFKQQGYHFVAFTEHDRLQTGEQWVACDPRTDAGRSIIEGDLLRAYQERFGDAWVEQRLVNALTEVRLKRMEEYRGLLEEPDRFLIMSGEEVTAAFGSGTLDETHWINVYNPAMTVPPCRTDGSGAEAMRTVVTTAEAIGGADGSPVLVSLNHPNWHWNATAEEILAVEELAFLEVHAALSTCRNDGDGQHVSVERMWDIVLALRLGQHRGRLLYGLATDDCHAYTPNHHLLGNWALPGRAWIVVRCAHLTPREILDAMVCGDFYASSGVGLTDIRMDARGIHLRIEPQAGTRYITRFIGTRRGFDPRSAPVLDEHGRVVRTTRVYGPDIGCVLAEVEGVQPVYRFAGNELYVRAVIESDRPHANPHQPGDVQKAWVQPVVPGRSASRAPTRRSIAC